MSQSNTVPKSFTPGQKAFYNLPSTASGPPAANSYGVPPWQVSGIFTTTAPITFPSGAPGATSTAVIIVPIALGWPSPVILKPSDLGVVTCHVSLAQNATNWLLGVPQILMQWASGTAITPSASSASQFVLSPGTTYTGPALNISMIGYLTGTNPNPVTALLTVQAVLYGKSIV